MATTTRTRKTKSKPQETLEQTFVPIKGKMSTKTHLVAERTIRCNGHMHDIGLASNGQLWIPSHTKKELDGFVMMGDLGNNPCKCAVVYDAWRNGQYNNAQIHDDFRREKTVTGRLATRLLKHQNKHRAWPNCDIVFGTLRPAKPDENGSFGWSDKPVNRFAEFITETVYRTLIMRGHNADSLEWYPGRSAISMNDPGKNPTNTYNNNFDTIFNASVSGHGYISPYIGGKLIENCAMYETTAVTDVPWRMLVDQSEAYINYLCVLKAQAKQLDHCREEFDNLAHKHTDRFGPLPKHSKIEIDKDNGLLTLSIRHPNLTIHTANRLIKHYRETEDKVRRLLKYNRASRERPWRFPAKPSRGLGALDKRGKAADKPVALRAVEGESYEA